MYHPVDETSFVERHEFVEISNVSGVPIGLDGYRMAGGIDFVFPTGASVPAGGIIVVARDREALLALGYPSLTESQVFGDYAGELDNGGDSVNVLDSGGAVVDLVSYSDEFPWPIGADGLGAGESWLPEEWLPAEAHRYKGMSLERVTCQTESTDPGNWRASSLDAATPGADNGSAAARPLPVVLMHRVNGVSGDTSVRPDEPALLTVLFAHGDQVQNATLEFFIDDIATEGELTQTRTLSSAASRHSVELPAQSANSIVRYRVLVDRGQGPEVISPRLRDPYAWHGYFVEPEGIGSSSAHHLFIAPSRWSELWDNIESGRAEGCNVNPRWQSRVPAVFAHQGRLYDVSVRYQGSRWNRKNGLEAERWPGLGPARPDPLLALSWRIGFPRYRTFEGRRVILLNKLSQGCPGYTTIVGFELFRRVGLPAPTARYSRFNINGHYYHYSLELQRVDGDLLESHQAKEGNGEPLGHLFKSSGFTGDEGPWGWGDGRLLNEACGYSAGERYAHTYSRETHEWDSHEALIALIEGMHEARASGDSTLATYLEATFDVDAVLSYLAVMNFIAPFDDMFQNYFLYQRRSDRKWLLLPWDLDQTFGGFQDARTSIFVGAEADEDNREGWFSYFKDSFFRAFRSEYQGRLNELLSSSLAESEINALLDQARASASPEEAGQAPAGVACDFDEALGSMKQFVSERHAYLQGILGQ